MQKNTQSFFPEIIPKYSSHDAMNIKYISRLFVSPHFAHSNNTSDVK